MVRKHAKEPQEKEEEEECAVKWILHHILLTYLGPTGVILPSVDNTDVYCP
jgi:hypothetical protein